MTTQTLTLADFLLARIAEDEADARAAIDDDEHWLHEGQGHIIQGDGQFTVTSGFDVLGRRWNAGDHIARHDPARVLAECEAKRRIVEWASAEDANPWECAPVLRALALPYADHEDYREEWAL